MRISINQDPVTGVYKAECYQNGKLIHRQEAADRALLLNACIMVGFIAWKGGIDSYWKSMEDKDGRNN